MEFQKLGLLRAHCKLFMRPESKALLFDPSIIDITISVEISMAFIPYLRQVVLRQNMHKLCESFNPSTICMDGGASTKRSTKKIASETCQNIAEMYVTYRRRSPDFGGKTTSWIVRVSRARSVTAKIDSSWVVPFSSRISITSPQRQIVWLSS